LPLSRLLHVSYTPLPHPFSSRLPHASYTPLTAVIGNEALDELQACVETAFASVRNITPPQQQQDEALPEAAAATAAATTPASAAEHEERPCDWPELPQLEEDEAAAAAAEGEKVRVGSAEACKRRVRGV
jgi:hypothetical protein